MTLYIKSIHKAAVLGWQTEGDNPWSIKGTEATLEAEDQEKRVVKNDGEAVLFYPLNFTGQTTVTVKGSHAGEDTANLVIS